MHAERARAEGNIDNIDDGLGNFRYIGAHRLTDAFSMRLADGVRCVPQMSGSSHGLIGFGRRRRFCAMSEESPFAVCGDGCFP